MALNPDPAVPGELLQGQVTVANRSADSLSGVTLELHYLDALAPLSDSLITDGAGSAPEPPMRPWFFSRIFAPLPQGFETRTHPHPRVSNIPTTPTTGLD